MSKRFQDQVAIITGGADGLGFALAQRLAGEGAFVAVFDFVEKNFSAPKRFWVRRARASKWMSLTRPPCARPLTNWLRKKAGWTSW